MDRRTLGKAGEDVAARYLTDRGWEILGRNVRLGKKEVDLIASRRGVLAFVEVKARRGSAYGDPLEAISPRKMEHLSRAAASWLREHEPFRGHSVRFDAIGVTWPQSGPPRVRHVQDAWRMG